MNTPSSQSPGSHDLNAQIIALQRMVAVLSLILLGSVAWLASREPRLPAVLTAERLDIVEADGSLAFALANSQRPAVATMDGEVLMGDQADQRRGIPSFIFFDGHGDEVGGLVMGAQVSDDGYSAVRHLSLDGYKQDQTVVLSHYQNPGGSSAGLRISDRPEELSLPEAFAELGLQPGATNAEMQAAIQALPEQGRNERLAELFGVPRLFFGSDRQRNASLVMHDGEGRPRLTITVPSEGEPQIQILDQSGTPVLTLP